MEEHLLKSGSKFALAGPICATRPAIAVRHGRPSLCGTVHGRPLLCGEDRLTITGPLRLRSLGSSARIDAATRPHGSWYGNCPNPVISYSWRMRIALLNSGLGLLATASEVHRLRPDADLIVAMDPDGMPWGPRTPQDIAERSLAIARAAAEHAPDVLVMACNTGTVHALQALRAEFEPRIPVVGTVPAIKPAAAAARSVAIWATVGTTASDYQRKLIADFGGSATVTSIACPGLATAIDAGDEDAIRAAVADAASRTPDGCTAVVLGCTEYELAADRIGPTVPGATLFGSAAAVAAQALRRAQAAGAAGPAIGNRLGSLRVLLSGRPGELPPAALLYSQGRALAQLQVGHDPAAALPV
jgi:glutamate racemase